MTEMVAGVSIGVSPSRLAMLATVPLLSGVLSLAAGLPPGVAGAGVGRSAGAGAVDGVPGRAARRRRGAWTVTGGSGVASVAGGGGADCARPVAGAPAAI